MNDNKLVEVTFNDAIQAQSFIPDDTPASLIDFHLDMNLGLLHLTFNDIINSSTLYSSGLTLQNSKSSDYVNFVTLTKTSYTESENGYYITLDLSSTDLNRIKANDNLCTELSNTYMSMRAEAFADNFGVDVISTSSHRALKAFRFTNDSTSPNLETFVLDMNIGALYLTFDETVRPNTIIEEEIILIGGPNITDDSYFQLTDGVYTSSSYTVIIVYIQVKDLNAIKFLVDLATSEDDTFISFSDDFIKDMNDNSITPIPSMDAQQAEDYIEDGVSPVLLFFSLNLTSNTLTLTFDETVNASSLDSPQITVQGHQKLQSNSYRTLKSSSGSDTDSTIITINLGLSDLNELKRLLDVATGTTNTYLSFTNTTIYDMNNNPVVPIYTQNAYMAMQFYGDDIRPELNGFSLNMSSEILTLSFSETVRVDTLSLSLFTLLNEDTVVDASAIYDLTGAIVITDNHHVVDVELTTSDLNVIKRIIDLATNESNTFLLVDDAAVEDMFMNDLVAISLDEPLLVDNFTPDEIRPTLDSFDLDVNSGELVLYFSETIDTSTFNVKEILLQDAEAYLNVSQYMKLTDNSYINSTDYHVLTVYIGYDDLNELKRLNILATSNSTTFISISDALLKDMNSNKIIELDRNNSLSVSTYISDTTSPNLESFNLDLNASLLTLFFDETVLKESLNVTEITLQHNTSSFGEFFTLSLSENSTSDSVDGTSIVINIGIEDLNELKRLTEIATDENTTYLSLTVYAITDMASVPVNDISIDDALNVDVFVQDDINPVLVSFSLDMNEALLVLTFSETVEAESLNISAITLQSTESALPNQEYTLIDGYLPHYSSSDSSDNTIIEINIGIEDLNAIKKIYQLATTVGNTFISIPEEVINDMVGLTVDPISTDEGQQVAEYIEDSESPILVNYSLDLSTELISLTFDETVNVHSLVINRIIIQSAPDNDNNDTIYSINLKHSADLSSENSTVVSFKLDYDDLNDIKLQIMLATRQNNTWLRLRSGAILDMAYDANAINSTVQNVNVFYPDKVNPNLESFFVNLNEGIIVINFDEPVDSGTLNVTGFTLHSGSDADESGEGSGVHDYHLTSYRLTSGYTNSSNGLQITLYLSDYDLNKIKQDEYLFIDQNTSYVSVSEEAIDDMNGNPINAIEPIDAIMAYNYISDTTPPVLLRFDLDMDNGVLVLYFPETVDVSTTDFDKIVIQRSANVSNDINRYMLSDGRLNMTEDGIKAYIQITHYDLNEIKERRIALDNITTWLTAEESTILDMNDRPLLPLVNAHSAKVVSTYLPDITRPRLRSFVLDLNANELILSFSETVDSDSVNVSAITLQDTPNGDYMFNHYTLSEDSSYVNYSYGPNVTIAIGFDDINNIKELIELAIDEESTFISVTDEMVLDVFENDIIPISSSNALMVSEYIKDETDPMLDYYDLDMNNKTLTLVFSETMNVSSMDITEFTLYEASNNIAGMENYTLYTSTSATEYDYIVTIDLSEDDFNEIKKLTNLATNKQNTHLSFTTNAIQDTDSNKVIPIEPTNAREVSMYTRDAQPPELRSFDLDMNGVTLTLTFSETVNVSSLDYSQITLQSDDYTMPEDYSLYSGTTSSTNGPIVTIYLLRYDEDNIKRIPTLATDEANTFISISSLLINDMDGLAVVNTTINVTDFIEDTTEPVLGLFNLNLTSDTLTLSFTETVNASSLDVTQIVLQGGEYINTSSYYRLTDSTFDYYDDPIIVIMLSFTDRNEIKRLTGLASRPNNTYLSLSEAAVLDMVELPLLPVFNFSADEVESYTFDTVAPSLVSYDFDLNQEVVLLTFTETVNINTLDATQIIFHGLRGSVHQLTGGIVLDSDHTYKPVLKLNDPDLNAIKYYLDMGVSAESTLIDYTSGLVEDMNMNPVNEADTLLVAEVYTSDTTDPALVSYDLDMNDRALKLTFTETVATLTLEPSEITLLSGPNATLNETFTFTSESYTTSDNGTEVDLMIGKNDFDDIARIVELATNNETTYLSITTNTIDDMNSRNVTSILPSYPQQVQQYTRDGKAPYLDSFSINFTSEILSLTFSETVNVKTFNISAITIQSDAYEPQTSVQLSAGELLNENDPIVNVKLADADLNSLKFRTELATSTEDTFISAPSNLVQDMAGNQLTAITPSNALNASEVVEDIISPILLNYDLDMDSGYITLYFSESVNESSLVFSAVTFQNTNVLMDGITISYNIVNDPVSISSHNDGIELILLLSSDDLSNIKKLVTLATRQNDTFLSVTVDFITDQFENELVEISPSDALRVMNYTRDTNCPEVTASEFDLNEGLLIVTFSEPVNTSTFTATEVYLYGTSSFIDPYHQVTLATYSDEQYSQVMTIKLSAYDLDTIKTNTILGTNELNTYVHMTVSAIEDTNGNDYCYDTIPQQVYNLIEDDTPPEIANFTLDMDKLELYLTFTESVQHTLIDFEEVVLLSDDNSSYIFVLTDGITKVDAAQPHIVVLLLTDDDANEIKHIVDLATEIDNTYLAMSNTTVPDYSDNYNVPIYEDDPLIAMEYRADNTTPKLVNFDLDMDEGLLILTLSEVVNISSVNVNGLTIQSELSISDSIYHTIQSGTASFDSLTEVIIELSIEDLNIIKELYTLADDETNSFLSIQSFFVKDNVDLYIDEVSNTSGAFNVAEFTRDTSFPELVQFALNMSSEILTLTFDETVDSSTLNVGGITIQSDDTESPEFFVDLIAGSISVQNSTIVYIQLSDLDLHMIKRRLDLATSDNNTCLKIQQNSVLDMAKNPLQTTYQCTDLLTPDNVRPRLVAFGANVNASELYLRFNEPMDIDSIDITQLTLQSVQDITDVSFYENFTLTEGNLSSTDLLLFTVVMSNDDLNEIKKLLSLLRGNYTTNIVIPPSFADDLNVNMVQAITSDNALTAETFYDDSERPYLQEYDLDMNTGLLSLYFSETINRDSFNITGLTLQLTSSNPNELQEFNLQIQNVLTPVDSPTLLVLIANDDLNVLKTRRIALTEETTFLRMTSNTVVDIVKRSVIPLEGVMVKSPRDYTPDTNKPLVEEFELDMNTGELKLSFNETIFGSTLMVDRITLTSFIGDTSDQNSFTLTTASSVVIVDEPVITIVLHNDDLNELKKRTNLTTNINNTFLFMAEMAISDTSGNNNAEVQPFNAIRAKIYVEDKVRPLLNDYELDMNTGILTMSFSETVNSSSLDTSGITFYNDDGLYTQSYTLSGGYDYVIPEYDPVIEIKITNDDLNEIKYRNEMATETNNTYLSVSSTTITDMNDNAIIQSTIKPLSEDNFTPDITPPMLEIFVIDMNLGHLILDFTETVLNTSVLYDYLALRANATLASVPENTNRQHQLERNVTLLTNSGPQLVIQLDEYDLNEIKRKDVCTIDLQEQDCYLAYRTGALTDMVANPIQGCRDL